jgi:hypothetical protein
LDFAGKLSELKEPQKLRDCLRDVNFCAEYVSAAEDGQFACVLVKVVRPLTPLADLEVTHIENKYKVNADYLLYAAALVELCQVTSEQITLPHDVSNKDEMLTALTKQCDHYNTIKAAYEKVEAFVGAWCVEPKLLFGKEGDFGKEVLAAGEQTITDFREKLIEDYRKFFTKVAQGF